MRFRSLVGKFFNKVIKTIPASYSEEIFYRIGRLLGVRSFTCEKDLGLFEGSINDNIVHRYYFRHGTWAPGLQYLLSTLLGNGPGTFIDVGANIGLTIIPIAKINESLKLYAFEPEYNNYHLLQKNILANGLESRIQPFNIALFSEDCALDMELSVDNIGDHRVRRQAISDLQSNYYREQSRPTIMVKARKLDSILKVQDLMKPIVLKIDTQGAEVRVCLGATNSLSEVDYLIVEYWPYGLQRMGDAPAAFFQIIQQFPWGAVYDDEVPAIPKLLPSGELTAHIDSCLPPTGIDHLDIFLSRHPISPAPMG